MVATEDTSSNEEVQKEKGISDCTIWVAKFVKDNPVLINKSQTSTIKNKKQFALIEMKKMFKEQFGQLVTGKQLMKKINNIKTSIRAKVHNKQTVNKKPKLTAAETMIYEVMKRPDSDNPALSKLPGLNTAGIQKTPSSPVEGTSSTVKPTPLTRQPPPPLPNKSRVLEQAETDETRKLLNTELQRLVLLEPLSYIRMKKQVLERVQLE